MTDDHAEREPETCPACGESDVHRLPCRQYEAELLAGCERLAAKLTAATAALADRESTIATLQNEMAKGGDWQKIAERAIDNQTEALARMEAAKTALDTLRRERDVLRSYFCAAHLAEYLTELNDAGRCYECEEESYERHAQWNAKQLTEARRERDEALRAGFQVSAELEHYRQVVDPSQRRQLETLRATLAATEAMLREATNDQQTEANTNVELQTKLDAVEQIANGVGFPMWELTRTALRTALGEATPTPTEEPHGKVS